MEHKTFGLQTYLTGKLELGPFSLESIQYLRNTDQIFPLIQDKNSGLTGHAIEWKVPYVYPLSANSLPLTSKNNNNFKVGQINKVEYFISIVFKGITPVA